MRALQLLAWSGIFLAAAALAGCGGGSSGGASAPSDAAYSVNIDTTTLAFNVEQGMATTPLTVNGDGAGTAPAPVFLVAGTLGAEIERVGTEMVGSRIKFVVYPKSGLGVGTYRGTVQLLVCRDQACSSQFRGSPAVVPYEIAVARPFGTDFSFYDESTVGSVPIFGVMNIQLPPGQKLFTATSSESWLQLTAQTATSLSYTTLPMPAGTYFGMVTLRSGDRTKVVVVRYRVGWRTADNLDAFLDDIKWMDGVPSGPTGAGDSLAAVAVKSDRPSLSFTAGSVAAPAQALGIILPAGATELTGEIVYRGAVQRWLNAAWTGERSVTVSVNPTGLPAGVYQADLLFRSSADVAPKIVPVLLHVR